MHLSWADKNCYHLNLIGFAPPECRHMQILAHRLYRLIKTKKIHQYAKIIPSHANVCQICQKEYTCSGGLSAHMKTHDENTEDWNVQNATV
jgi:hypothetical protein